MAQVDPSQAPLHFIEPDLIALTSDVLKRMSRTWGGKGNETKDACVRRILAGLADEGQVRAMLASLSPDDRAALAFIKMSGGLVRAGRLVNTVRAAGYGGTEPDTGRDFYSTGSKLVGGLLRRGLVLPAHPDPYPSIGTMTYQGVPVDWSVYADSRVLRHVDWPLTVRPLPLTPVAAPPASLQSRRSQHVLLDLVTVARAFAEAGPLHLTQGGTVRVADVRRFLKRLHWSDPQVFDGHPFPDPARALILVWQELGLLRQDHDALVLSEEANEFAGRPFPDQVRGLLHAFSEVAGWWEASATDVWGHVSDPRPLRTGTVVGLHALPDARGCYIVDDFVTALYARVGGIRTSSRYRPSQPYQTYGKTKAEHAHALRVWEEELRADWLEHEGPVVRGALTTWLYWLGIVALGETQGRLVLQLTDLGRAVLFGQELTASAAAPAEAATPAWFVQPNYDIVVYLDAVTAEQLAFLEQHAERTQAEAHTAHYVLTRESVNRGLHAGTTIQQVLEALRGGSGAALPQNVERELQEWASQREQIVIHTRGRVVAFPSAEARERAVQAGLRGEPLGERHLRVHLKGPVRAALTKAAGLSVGEVVDYAQPLPKCLQVAEDGTITRVHRTEDLLLEGQLASIAEQINTRHWRLTRESLSRARGAGATAASVLALLATRLVMPLPKLAEVALRNALGGRATVHAGEVLALRITDRALYTALTTSPLLEDYLLDTPGPDTILVDPAKRSEFEAVLEWLSVRLVPLQRVEERPDWEQTVRDARAQQRYRRRRY